MYVLSVPEIAPEVEFAYRLLGSGWSEARLAFGERWTELSASYLTDALGDLLRAVLTLKDGARSARVSWEEEPGEFRWLFTRAHEAVDVRVLWFNDQLPQFPDADGQERIAGRVAVDVLAAAVAAGAREVLERYGAKGYHERWVEHPFPTAELDALECGAAAARPRREADTRFRPER
jgi:hypothetical protein